AGGIIAFASASQAQVETIIFSPFADTTALTLPLGGTGTSVDITARSSVLESEAFVIITPSSVGIDDPGGITSKDLSKRGGVGVRSFDGNKFGGSGGISGKGGAKDEELIFTFDLGGVSASSLKITITDLQIGSSLDDGDDPVIFVRDVLGNNFVFSELNGVTDTGIAPPGSNIGILPGLSVATTDLAGNAFASGVKDPYNVNFGDFNYGAGVDPATVAIREVRVREVGDHIFVNGIQAAPIPEPSSAALIGLSMALPLLRRRRR
ncbi:MAG: PEP-CTERM sorting domain-containing protein, partial [Verrucomicrobiales bacterium]